MFDELILILTQFGGGPGDPANNVVRFLLAGFFWSVLYIVSYRLWRETADRRHLYFLIASCVGASRELFMFVAEYGSYRGFFSFATIFRYYPPIEHAVAILSIVLMGYAFLRTYFNFERFSRYFLIGCTLMTVITYVIITPLWLHFLDGRIAASLTGGVYIGAQFHDFPGDLIFRLEGTLVSLLILGAFLCAKTSQIRIPWLAFVAFFCFFLDDALQAFNDLNSDRYAPVFGPIRHNLHIVAIVLLVGVYWWEVTRQLKKQEKFLNTLLDAIPDLISYKDRQDVYLGCNRNFASTLVGKTKAEIIGRKGAEIQVDQSLRETSTRIDQQVLESDRYQTYEQNCTLADGRLALLETIKTPFHDTDGNVAGVIDIARDITARRHLEEQLIHSQKLDAIGQLAGGVAHDFNNILAIIQGYVTIMQTKSGPDHALAKYLGKISDSTDRATSLIKSLMAFSRKQTMSARIYDLNEILTTFKEFLGRIIPEDIEFKIDCHPEPLNVYIDKNQLEQALTNLVANARDAMPRGGELTISTRIQMRDADFVRAQGFGEPGRYAQISVTDTGCGMTEATRQKIFEPFFTTKEVGKGTGLGLAIVYGIVKQNRGYVTVHSAPEQGSTFCIDLPFSMQQRIPEESLTQGIPLTGRETILVVEDEADLREMVGAALQQFGYKVILAKNGLEAIQKFDQQKKQIALVLMDLVMPVMNGKDAASKIRQIRPDVRILFISGYAQDIIQSRGDLDPGEDLLTKPINPRQLLQHIRTMLDKASR